MSSRMDDLNKAIVGMSELADKGEFAAEMALTTLKDERSVLLASAADDIQQLWEASKPQRVLVDVNEKGVPAYVWKCFACGAWVESMDADDAGFGMNHEPDCLRENLRWLFGEEVAQ